MLKRCQIRTLLPRTGQAGIQICDSLRKAVRKFPTCECGSVTTDYVALCAGVLVAGVLAIGSLMNSVTFTSDTVAHKIERSTTFSYASAGMPGEGSEAMGAGGVGGPISSGKSGVIPLSDNSPEGGEPGADEENQTTESAPRQDASGQPRTRQVAAADYGTEDRVGRRGRAAQTVRNWLGGRGASGARGWAQDRLARWN